MAMNKLPYELKLKLLRASSRDLSSLLCFSRINRSFHDIFKQNQARVLLGSLESEAGLHRNAALALAILPDETRPSNIERLDEKYGYISNPLYGPCKFRDTAHVQSAIETHWKVQKFSEFCRISYAPNYRGGPEPHRDDLTDCDWITGAYSTWLLSMTGTRPEPLAGDTISWIQKLLPVKTVRSEQRNRFEFTVLHSCRLHVRKLLHANLEDIDASRCISTYEDVYLTPEEQRRFTWTRFNVIGQMEVVLVRREMFGRLMSLINDGAVPKDVYEHFLYKALRDNQALCGKIFRLEVLRLLRAFT